MITMKFFFVILVIFGSTNCAISADVERTASDVIQDIYYSCLRDFSVSCAKPKALQWISDVSNNDKIKITEDLVIMKKDTAGDVENSRQSGDIFDKLEDFLQSHQLVVRAPSILKRNGPLGSLVPRNFQPEDLKVPLAATGRSSKIVKKVIVPFLLGLKFKTAVLVPLALALIAVKTWKALTLGLLSLVLTGALVVFKLTKPKVVNYEVIHYPQHLDHHVEHVEHVNHVDHVDHVHTAPSSPGWDHAHAAYGRSLTANEMAYNAYRR